MKIHHIYIAGLAMMLLGYSCREVYYPDELDSTRQIPVIQGMILENEVPVVTLSWALGYREKEQQFISGAQVSVTDDRGNIAELSETYPGTYTVMHNGLTGITGRVYTLKVTLPDGHEYESAPVPLPGNPFIDSLYAEPVIETVFEYNEKNEPVPNDEPGLKIMADLSLAADSIRYFRFNTRVVKEMLYSVDIGTPASHSVFIWEVNTLDDFYAVNHTAPQGNRQVLREHTVGFLPYVYDASLETENSTAPYTVGWVLTFNVYSISAEVYAYYNSIEQQLNASDQIFAPVPSQVKSNIYCTSDPESEVIGVFEASSKTILYKAFGWVNLDRYNHLDLSSFPEITQGGTTSRFPPYFWISF